MVVPVPTMSTPDRRGSQPLGSNHCPSRDLLAKSLKLKLKYESTDQAVSADLKRNLQQAREQGASSWLSALPLEKHGFALNKAEFRDAIALRYNRHINNLPSFCVCGSRFDVTHAMNCNAREGGR